MAAHKFSFTLTSTASFTVPKPRPSIQIPSLSSLDAASAGGVHLIDQFNGRRDLCLRRGGPRGGRVFKAVADQHGIIITPPGNVEADEEGVDARIRPYFHPLKRTQFPPHFVFGASSAAYQSEGAADIDRRGPSIWDTFTKLHPEKIADRSNGDVAEDFYHRYKSDVQLMKQIGLDTFRFSISWSRIFPQGRGIVNELGVQFYNNLINELLHNGITPFVTLFHWDVPQALEDEYSGFLSHKIVDDFRHYTDFCFKEFGDRVKHWITLNEPHMFATMGYNDGRSAPGRCSDYMGNCTAGDSATEPYTVAHHLLLSHAAAVGLYKTNYQFIQRGQIGITLATQWIEPKSQLQADRDAANRALDFYLGWNAHPITYGDYPQVMRSIVGDRLPKFTKEESEMLKGSYDFLGLNYYTAIYAEHPHSLHFFHKSYTYDIHATFSTSKDGLNIGTPTALTWLYMYPEGLHKLLVHVKRKYQNPTIYITENGVAEANNASIPVEEAIMDDIRIKYHDRHLRSVLRAIWEEVNVKGYFVWAFMDDFEWSSGYTVRFGLTYVDFKNLKRYLKDSAYWFKMFLSSKLKPLE